VWLPQFLYWKATTGSYLFFSYGDERFYFGNPHIIAGLFGYRKGWLLYTPIMIMALIGIILMKPRQNPFSIGLYLFIPLNIYIIVSWWCWWYGGGFGNRPFIDSYPLLALGLATLFHEVSKNRIALSITTLVSVLLFSLNIFQNYQYHYGSIHWDSMTKDAYWDSAGHLYPTKNFYYLLEPPDYERALKGEY
jgi:hypothetical protein